MSILRRLTIYTAICIALTCNASYGNKTNTRAEVYLAETAQRQGDNSAANPNGEKCASDKIKKYEMLFVMLLSLSVSTIAISLAWIILSRRATRRSLLIFNALPGRTGVCARDERILFLHTEKEQLNRKGIKYLKELKYIDYGSISAAVSTVFNTHETITFDYDYQDIRRSVTISPLDKSVFGEEAVIWFSHDNAELQQAREQAEHFAEQNSINLSKLRQTTRMWRIVLNALPIHIFAKDPKDDFRFVFANAETLSFFGRDITGLTDFEVFPPEDAAKRRQEDIQNMGNLDEGIELTYPITDKNGKIHHMRDIRYPFVDESGKQLLLGAALDISELVEERQKNKDTEMLWNKVIDAFPMIFYAKDPDDDFKFIMANKATCDFLGIPAEELIGKTDESIGMLKDLFPDIRKRDIEAVETGKTGEITLPILDHNQNERYVRIIRKPITLPNGKRFLFFANFDVTDLHALIENENLTNRALFQIALENNFQKNLKEIFGILKEKLKYDFAFIAQFDDKKNDYSILDGSPIPQDISIDILADYFERAQRTRKEKDVIEFQIADGSEPSDNPIKSAVTNLMHIDDKYWGAFVLGYKSVNEFPESSKKLILSLTKIFILAIIRRGTPSAD